jgi:hypothetical protein
MPLLAEAEPLQFGLTAQSTFGLPIHSVTLSFVGANRLSFVGTPWWWLWWATDKTPHPGVMREPADHYSALLLSNFHIVVGTTKWGEVPGEECRITLSAPTRSTC